MLWEFVEWWLFIIFWGFFELAHIGLNFTNFFTQSLLRLLWRFRFEFFLIFNLWILYTGLLISTLRLDLLLWDVLRFLLWNSMVFFIDFSSRFRENSLDMLMPLFHNVPVFKIKNPLHFLIFLCEFYLYPILFLQLFACKFIDLVFENFMLKDSFFWDLSINLFLRVERYESVRNLTQVGESFLPNIEHQQPFVFEYPGVRCLVDEIVEYEFRLVEV